MDSTIDLATPHPAPLAPSRRAAPGPSRWLAPDVAVKLLLVALLTFAIWHRDWARFADKAMLARAALYPPLVAAAPLAYLLVRRCRPHRAGRYPAFACFLLTVPFVVDVAGNALDLYDRVDVFDDVCHFVNWALLGGALGAVLVTRIALPPLAVGSLVCGFGAVIAVIWELAEYLTFVTHTSEQFTIYRDTMGDLALGLAGSALAGCVCAVGAHRVRARRRRPRRRHDGCRAAA